MEPWFCDVCHAKNIATDTICIKCHNPRGTKDPLSKEVLLTQSEKIDTLSDPNLVITMADGTNNSPLAFEVFATHNPILTPIDKEELPLLIFKNIGQITIFINKHHPLFSDCNVAPEQIVASEIAMYLYDERQNLANYSGHNLSNITWSVIKKNWLNVLDLNPSLVLSKAIDLLESIKERIASALGSDGAFYFDDLTVEQKKALTDMLIKKGVDLTQIGVMKDTGKYILYAPYDFLLSLYSSCTDSFFNGGVWSVGLSDGSGGLLDQDTIDHVNNKIKQQYRNSLEDIVNFARDKYDDELTLRRVQLSIEFLQKRLVE